VETIIFPLGLLIRNISEFFFKGVILLKVKKKDSIFLIDSNAQPNHSFKENRISLQNKNDKRRGSQLHSGYQ
jgi:hypothetical protein